MTTNGDYYKRKTKEVLYAVVDYQDKVLGIGSMIQLAEQFNVNRHTINATYKGKMKLRGIYSVRQATEEEAEPYLKQKHIHYADAHLQNVKNYEQKIDPFEEKAKEHIPMPYRSSSARRFTPL